MEVWWPPIKVNFTPFINMTLRVFEAFSGVGSQRMALRNLGVAHEVVATSDVDEFAVKSYATIHDGNKIVPQVTDEKMQDYLEKRNIPLNDKGARKNLKGKKLREFYEACVKSNNLGDISKVDTQDIPDHDLFTYSFPCQDISVAGNGLGLDEGSDTRSGLLWECQKIISGKKPKYLLLENVKNLVGKRHKPNFDKWLEWLEEEGYTNYWQVLNAKNYGVPQNRERVFVVSILGEHESYEFPEPINLELRLKDMLEDEVDEKFYLSDEKTKTLITNSSSNESPNGLMEVGSLSHYKRNDINRVYSPLGSSPTLNTMQGGDRQPKVLIENATKGVVIAASRGRNPENPSGRTVGSPTEQRLEINKQGTSNTITTVQKDNYVIEPSNLKHTELPCIYDDRDKGFGIKTSDVCPAQRANRHGIKCIETDHRIRKLTPKECWRLMGFSDGDFYKAKEVNSNTQLYKQAGNSIVVDVLEGIFKQLLEVAE